MEKKDKPDLLKDFIEFNNLCRQIMEINSEENLSQNVLHDFISLARDNVNLKEERQSLLKIITRLSSNLEQARYSSNILFEEMIELKSQIVALQLKLKAAKQLNRRLEGQIEQVRRLIGDCDSEVENQ